MKMYLVREAGTTKVHGIFWAQTPTGLRHAVEEMADPSLFEWAQITRPGGVWREDEIGAAPAMPDCRDFPLSREGEVAFGRAFDRAFDFGFSGFGERLVEMIASQGDHDWTCFDAAHEGDGRCCQTDANPSRTRQERCLDQAVLPSVPLFKLMRSKFRGNVASRSDAP